MLLLAPHILASPHRFLLHIPTRTAICSDLHLGFESALASAGTPMPDFTSAPLAAAWQKLLETRPARIVIAGDLFHSAEPDAQTIASARKLLESPRHPAHDPPPILIIPGNHDPSVPDLQKIFAGAAIQIAHTTTAGEYHIFHGHLLPPSAKSPGHPPLILGHQHPAVTLTDHVQSAKMLCFATITPKSSNPIILLPAFSSAPLGTNLLTARHWIIDLSTPSPDDIRIAGIVKDLVLDFGQLSGLE